MPKIFATTGVTLLCTVLHAQVPTVEWQQQAEAEGASIHPTRTAVDSQGNTYVAGHFGDAMHVGDTVLQVNNAPTVDVFLSKFDAEGAHLWSRSFGAEGTDQVYGLCVDAEDHVLIAGRTSSEVMELGGITITKGASNFAGFWARFDGEGTCTAARATDCVAPFPALSNTSINAITTDAAGRIYITGGWRADTLRFDGHVLVNERPTDQVLGTNVFVARFTVSGVCEWLIGNGPGTVPGNSNAGYAIEAAATGKVFVGGVFGGNRMLFGTRMLECFDLDEGFYASLDAADGSVDWVRAVRGANVGSNTYDGVNAVVAGANGELFVSGNYVGHQVDVDSLLVLPSPLNVNANKGFVLQVQANDGLPVWGRVLGESATGNANVGEMEIAPTGEELALSMNYNGEVEFGAVAPPSAVNTNGLTLLMDLNGIPTRGLALTGNGGQSMTGAVYDAAGDMRVCGKYDGTAVQMGAAAWSNPQSTGQFYTLILCKLGIPPVGVQDLARREQLHVFPNPCADALWLQMEDTTDEVELRIISLDGRVVSVVHARPMNGSVRVDTERLSAGTYLLHYVLSDRQGAVRFVRE
ncbi:MAG TPA: T9SS type A sorting domain-containing protein [Flavobacteriales bacterium]|nr:T9SS type A sorting domain-containing protein [Flavobacteriales bacterium]